MEEAAHIHISRQSNNTANRQINIYIEKIHVDMIIHYKEESI